MINKPKARRRSRRKRRSLLPACGLKNTLYEGHFYCLLFYTFLVVETAMWPILDPLWV